MRLIYLTFGCPKHGPGRARDRGQNVCFVSPFSIIFVKNSFAISEKRHSKKGSRAAYDAETDSLLAPPRSGLSEVVGTLLKLRLRRHQPRGFILVHATLSAHGLPGFSWHNSQVHKSLSLSCLVALSVTSFVFLSVRFVFCPVPHRGQRKLMI